MRTAPPSRKFAWMPTGQVITDPAQYHPETGAFLGDPALPRAIPDPHVPNGLRTVDGSYNNLIAGTGDLGRLRRADAAPLRAVLRQRRRRRRSRHVLGGRVTHSAARPVTNNNYGAPGNVADADPRTISNLVVDMTINNPAAILAALTFAGSEDPMADLQEILARNVTQAASGATRGSRSSGSADAANECSLTAAVACLRP